MWCMDSRFCKTRISLVELLKLLLGGEQQKQQPSWRVLPCVILMFILECAITYIHPVQNCTTYVWCLNTILQRMYIWLICTFLKCIERYGLSYSRCCKQDDVRSCLARVWLPISLDAHKQLYYQVVFGYLILRVTIYYYLRYNVMKKFCTRCWSQMHLQLVMGWMYEKIRSIFTPKDEVS